MIENAVADVLGHEHLPLSNNMVEESVKGDMPHSHTRNSSGDDIANMNFLYDDFVYVL